MKKINTGRALLGGIVAAVIIDLIEGVVHGVVLQGDWVEAMAKLGKHDVVTPGALVIYNFVGVLMGIIGVWLYSALTSRYGSGSITAAKAGLVVFALASVLPNLLQVPGDLFPAYLMTVSVITDFFAIMLGVTMGALLYREEGLPLAQSAHA